MRMLPVLVALTLLAPGGAAARSVRIEAEDGRIVDPLCARETNPDERMIAEGSIMFFPGDRCQAEYDTTTPALAYAAAVRRVTSIRFSMSGNGQVEHCGWFALTGGTLAGTPVRCALPGVWVDAPVRGLPRVGSVTLTWHPANGTASFANAFVDWIDAR